MKRTSLMAVLILAFALAGPVSAEFAVLSDSFNDDGAGNLSGQTADTGQVWGNIDGRTPLDTGPDFGQGDNGAGNANDGSGNSWKASQIPLGQTVNDGTVVISVDYKKQHITGPINEMNLALKSSSQGKELALIWAADWLKMGGFWTFGGGQINTGVPESIHVELTLHLVDGGENTAEFSFEEIGNPANNGSLVLSGSLTGTLNFDTFELWGLTRNGKVVGFDNVSIVAEGEAPPVVGDADGDRDVDDDDLSLLLANWGQDTDWAHGEFSGAPPVNDDDLSLLLANWTGSAAAVPEPATAAIVLTVLAASSLRRRSRR